MQRQGSGIKKLIKSSGIFETDCPLVRDREENDQDNRLKF